MHATLVQDVACAPSGGMHILPCSSFEQRTLIERSFTLMRSLVSSCSTLKATSILQTMHDGCRGSGKEGITMESNVSTTMKRLCLQGDGLCNRQTALNTAVRT